MNRELAMTYLSRAMDGELPNRQRADLDAWLAAHPEDREIADGWKAQGVLARAQSAAIPVPDEERAWQDIRRAIRLAAPQEAKAAPAFFPWRFAWLGAIIALVYASVLGVGLWRGQRPAETVAKVETVKPAQAQIEWAETEVAGASTMVYQDEDSGCAVVWLMTDDSGDAAKSSG